MSWDPILGLDELRQIDKVEAHRRAHRKRKSPEADHQAALFRWALLNTNNYPELGLMFHIPNGGSRKSAVEGARLKAQGVKAGVPDLCLPYPARGYHGLFIELKAEGGRLTPEQKCWIDHLTKAGYKAVMCVGWDQAREVIEDYLADDSLIFHSHKTKGDH